MGRIELYFHTLQHLKLLQILWRLHYLVRNKIRLLSGYRPELAVPHPSQAISLISPIPRPCSLHAGNFTFINRAKRFAGPIDWNFSGYGKLWCYNLTYFDFLNQPKMMRTRGLSLINDFIDRLGDVRDGCEPYPISLRIINWIRFISCHGVRDERIDASLYAQSLLLTDNLEYHLLGNHLLENGFALLFAGVYFDSDFLLDKAARILTHQLEEQILNDGGHFELSPMYHQIILDRLLDCINLLQNNADNATLLDILKSKTSVMLGWLKQMTFANGDIPLVNDASFGIAPTTAALFAYGERLGVTEKVVPLNDSGYRKIVQGRYEIVVDVGKIGPDYIPGHAHSDMLSFVLYLDGKPLIVDTGTSTYITNARRLAERQTAAHNTVQVGGIEQSEVWGGFRVGRRAYIRDLVEDVNKVSAKHTGYERIGVSHRREFFFSKDSVIITDFVSSKHPHECQAYLHFHPEVDLVRKGETFRSNTVLIHFSGAIRVQLAEYEYAPEFNRKIPAQMLVISFYSQLSTEIHFEISDACFESKLRGHL